VHKRSPCRVQDLNLDFAASDEEAAERAERFKRFDPFPDIPAALLSAADIEDYARITGMLHRFYPVREFLKPASYEVRPGRKFVRWDENRQKIEEVIQKDRTYLCRLILSYSCR
jgi:hypothetical protein